MKETELVRENSREVLFFLKERYPLFHLSNVFFRDMHYGIREYLEKRGVKMGYSAAEDVTREFIRELEGQKILAPIDRQTWTLHYPEFRLPPAKPAQPARPAAKPVVPPKPQSDEKA